jgi:hypothetical protein
VLGSCLNDLAGKQQIHYLVPHRAATVRDRTSRSRSAQHWWGFFLLRKDVMSKNPGDGVSDDDRRIMEGVKEEEDFGKLTEKVRDQSPAGKGIKNVPGRNKRNK